MHYDSTSEEILDTIVSVDNSSGVIVYSNSKYTLVLTDYHVVSDLVNINGTFISNKKPHIIFKYIISNNNKHKDLELSYESEKVYVDHYNDIALIRVNIGIKLRYSEVAIGKIDVGEEIYLASNPNNNYKTITRGIISNKNRRDRQYLWQTDAGIIYGASGGGSFLTNGKLIGLIQSVDIYSPVCKYQGNILVRPCVRVAIPYIGFFIPPDVIKKFLLSTEFADKFKYLR